MLRRRGLFVDLAADGLEAVERLDPERHDAVFMDCQMPNLDGYEATARIRAAEPADRHIPIVAMTAHAFAGDRERCLHAGMDDYLRKPLASEDLDPVLERWLAGPAVSAPTALGRSSTLRLGSCGPGPGARGGLRPHDAAAARRAARRRRARRRRPRRSSRTSCAAAARRSALGVSRSSPAGSRPATRARGGRGAARSLQRHARRTPAARRCGAVRTRASVEVTPATGYSGAMIAVSAWLCLTWSGIGTSGSGAMTMTGSPRC